MSLVPNLQKKDKQEQLIKNGKQAAANGKIVANGNGHANGYANGKVATTNGKSHFYESMYPLETSYSTTRQRVFVETNQK